MVDMYVNQKTKAAEIGKKLNINQSTVYNKLKQLGVKMRTSTESLTKELDIVKLEDLYVNQKMSVLQLQK